MKIDHESVEWEESKLPQLGSPGNAFCLASFCSVLSRAVGTFGGIPGIFSLKPRFADTRKWTFNLESKIAPKFSAILCKLHMNGEEGFDFLLIGM